MKNPIKRIKEWLAFILTLLVVVFLFGIIFIELGITAPTPSFYVELSIVVILTVMMKIWWYDYTEEKRLNEQDILEEKEKYYRIIDSTILDTNDLDKYLVILNQENRDHFIKNKIGSRTAKNLSKKTKWLCFIHPEYKKMKPEEIGVLRTAPHGFVTENGYFVDRDLGLLIAKYYNQIEYKYNPQDKLLSEDLNKENLKVLKRINKYSYKEK